jgi:glycylpeptide N-tetradecanoyltransferase
LIFQLRYGLCGWVLIAWQDGGRITDFFSFYALETSVISSSSKHKKICAAYLSYYATEVAPKESKKELKIRLNALINDALIIANRVCVVPSIAS